MRAAVAAIEFGRIASWTTFFAAVMEYLGPWAREIRAVRSARLFVPGFNDAAPLLPNRYSWPVRVPLRCEVLEPAATSDHFCRSCRGGIDPYAEKKCRTASATAGWCIRTTHSHHAMPAIGAPTVQNSQSSTAMMWASASNKTLFGPKSPCWMTTLLGAVESIVLESNS